jgi:hypothetical protein
LSPGLEDGGKYILHIGLPGIETNGKQVLLGVIAYFQDTPEIVDAGAHGVGAADSDKPALLYQARHAEIYAFAIHGESSSYSVHPGSRLHPARLLLEWGKRINFTKFCLSAHHGCAVSPGWIAPSTRPGTGNPC